jgi:hypothetical protein
MTTIKQLRYAKYKVRVMHERTYKTIKKMDGEYKEVFPRGGKTKIEITTPDQSLTATGISICSNEDSFNRRTGNQIALGRALKELHDKGHTPKFYNIAI